MTHTKLKNPRRTDRRGRKDSSPAPYLLPGEQHQEVKDYLTPSACLQIHDCRHFEGLKGRGVRTQWMFTVFKYIYFCKLSLFIMAVCVVMLSGTQDNTSLSYICTVL